MLCSSGLGLVFWFAVCLLGVLLGDIASLFSLQVAACVYVGVCLPVAVGFVSVGVMVWLCLL